MNDADLVHEDAALKCTGALDTQMIRMEQARRRRAQARVIVRCVRQALEELTEKQRDVVSRHFGLNGPSYSLQEIAKSLNITKEAAWHIKSRAFARLRSSPLLQAVFAVHVLGVNDFKTDETMTVSEVR